MSTSCYSVREFGAMGDGLSIDTKAIQAAIDTCAQDGGGRVRLPSGTYVTGTVFLRSHVDLHLESSATLLGSPDPKDYDESKNMPNDLGEQGSWHPSSSAHLIFARDATSVAITGQGTIDGNGRAFFGDLLDDGPTRSVRWRKPKAWRPGRMINLANCRNVVVRDVRIIDAPMWAVWLLGCDEITVDGIHIHSPFSSINSDGIDIDCCRNVHISNCTIETGDDCIAIFTNTQNLEGNEIRPTENVVVTNCVLSTPCCGIRIGFHGDTPIRNLAFSNIVMHNTRHGIDIVIPRFERGLLAMDHGPIVADVTFDNIIMEAELPFYLWVGTNAVSPAGMSRIRFSNIRAYSVHCSYIGGLPGLPVEGIVFDNVHVTYSGDMDDFMISDIPTPEKWRWNGYDEFRGLPYAFFVRHVNDITFHNLRIDWGDLEGPWRSAIWAESASDLHFDGLVARQAYVGSPEPTLNLRDVEDVTLTNCRASQGTGTFLRLEGRGEHIRLTGNDLSHAQAAWEDRRADPQKKVLRAVNNLLPE